MRQLIIRLSSCQAVYSYLNINPQNYYQPELQRRRWFAFVFNLNDVFGLKADFMGYGGGTGWTDYLIKHGYPVSGSASGNAFTYMFRPRIKHSGKFQPFGEALVGAYHSNGYATIISCIEGNNPCSSKNGNGNNNGFAMEFGGGLDIALFKACATAAGGSGLYVQLHHRQSPQGLFDQLEQL